MSITGSSAAAWPGYDLNLLCEVMEGLGQTQKTLPSKLFYDKRGSELFDRICELDEYYPTRTELGIMRDEIGAMVEALGEGVVLFELGSGSSLKTRVLLDHLPALHSYVPVDISEEHLHQTADALREDYPDMAVHPVVADYTRPFDLPEPVQGHDRIAAYFPGSTIGNFTPEQAADFLKVVAGELPDTGKLLIGVDLDKDRGVLEAAYNDARGVTAAFNKNLLRRLNEELGANFPLDRFDHYAFYNGEHARIEMHLVARSACVVEFGSGHAVEFAAGETIHTENSYKFSRDRFAALAAQAGFEVERVWTDADELFSVQLLRKAA